MSDTTTQLQDPGKPAAHIAPRGLTFGQSGVPPLSERCANPPHGTARLDDLRCEWAASYANVSYLHHDYSKSYAEYFLRLLNALRSEAIVARLVMSYFKQHRATGLFRRKYDALDYDQTKAFIAEILGDLPTREFPLPHELAKAYYVFEFFLKNFRFNPLLPTAPNGRSWIRSDETQLLSWLKMHYDHHLPTNFNG